MNAIAVIKDEKKQQTLHCLARPNLWGLWPFLPLLRRRTGRLPQEGVLYDTRRARSLPGHEWTVFFSNVFTLPQTIERLLALPKEVYTSAEQIVNAGWVVD